MMNLAKKAKKALDNVICSSCYALKGFYQMPTCASLQAKANFITDSITRWRRFLCQRNGSSNVPSITTQKAKRKSSRIAIRTFSCMIREIYFLQSILIAGFVFARVADIRFWFPTREYVRQDQMPHLQKLASLKTFVLNLLQSKSMNLRLMLKVDGTAVYSARKKQLPMTTFVLQQSMLTE